MVAKIPSISNNEKYNLFNLLNSAHLLYGSEEMKHYKVYYAAEFYKKRDYEQELYETYRSSGKFHQLMTNEEVQIIWSNELYFYVLLILANKKYYYMIRTCISILCKKCLCKDVCAY